MITAIRIRFDSNEGRQDLTIVYYEATPVTAVATPMYETDDSVAQAHRVYVTVTKHLCDSYVHGRFPLSVLKAVTGNLYKAPSLREAVRAKDMAFKTANKYYLTDYLADVCREISELIDTRYAELL